MEVTFSEAKIPAPPPQKPIKPAPVDDLPAAVEPPPTPAARTPSVAELDQATKDLYDSMGWDQPKASAAAEPQPPAEPAAEPAAAAAPAEPPAEQEPEPELTPREMIAETARATAQAVAQAIAPRETPPPAAEPAPGFELNPQDAQDLDVLRYMARTNPQQYGGIDKRFQDWCKQHYDYQAAWLAANPDKEFNPDDDEHSQFYSQNQPDIDPDGVEKSRLDMLVEKKFEEKVAPERAREKAKQAFEEALPGIAKRIDAKVHAMVCQMNPELGKLISGPNGEAMLTNETVAKIDEADPISKKIADRIVAEELEPMILELEKIALPDLKYGFDPDKNPIHRKIANFLGKQEAEMAKAPRNVQVRNGAQWMSLREYNTRLNGITQSSDSQAAKDARTAELNRNYWTLTVDDASDLIVDYAAKKARAMADEEDALAKRKYGRPAGAAGAPAAAAPARVANPPANQPRKPSSPAIGGQPDVATAAGGSKIPQKSFGETAADVNFR